MATATTTISIARGVTAAVQATLNGTGSGIIPAVGVTEARTAPPPPPAPAPVVFRDPLAQTFEVKSSIFLSGVELWFAAAPSGGVDDVVVRVFEVENGVPTSRQVGGDRAMSSKTAAQVGVDVAAGTVTLFAFPEPLYLEGNKVYALHVKTRSPDYTVYVAKIGELRVGETSDAARYRSVTSEAAASGSLLVSADDRTWASVPNSDLYFRLQVAKYSNVKTIEFLPISGANQCGFRLEPSTLLPKDVLGQGQVSASWFYKLDAGTIWTPFTPYSDVFTTSTFSTLTVKTELVTNSQNAAYLTPLVDADDLNLTLFSRQTTGAYATRVITVDEAYDTLRVNVKIRKTAPSAFVDWYFTDQTAAPGTVPTWSAASVYAPGAVVSHGGFIWYAVASSGPTATVPAEGSTWTKATIENALVWRIIPTNTETITALNQSHYFGYQQHERILELPPNPNRTQCQVMFKVGIGTNADAVDPPEVTDLIVILSE